MKDGDNMYELNINVNGIDYKRNIDPSVSLLHFLRNDLGLIGTKEGCNEGECGACTVIVEGMAIDSCLMLAARCDGKKVLTIEGIGSDEKLDPLQKAFLDGGAVQCGFCTSGMIMAAKAMLDVNKDPSYEEIKESVMGNLCRCTGYNKIFSSIQDAAKVYKGLKSHE